MKKIISLTILSSLFILLNSACVTIKHKPGKHKGWTKNTNNPHHPKTTNPGHTKMKKNNAPSAKPKGKNAATK